MFETAQCNLQMGIHVLGGTPPGILDLPPVFTQIPLCEP